MGKLKPLSQESCRDGATAGEGQGWVGAQENRTEAHQGGGCRW